MPDKSKAAILNPELFIARRLLRGKGNGTVSVPIVKIALAGIALGVCVMLLSVFILTGFKNEITDKLSGFTAHLNITAYENNSSYEGGVVIAGDSLLAVLRELDGVRQAYPYVTKPAILKSAGEIHGVILKGVDSGYQADFYHRHIKDGEYPDFNREKAAGDILLSSSVAALLNVKVGDKLSAHFVQDPPRVRRLVVKGIYDTGFKEYDDMIVLCDIKLLQRLNDWTPEQVTGIGVELDDLNGTEQMEVVIDGVLPLDEENNFYKVTNLKDTAPQVFDWLELLNMNIWIILILIVIVAGFNMVSGLLILILDKTAMIGILKALGAPDVALKKVFLYLAVALSGQGVLLGNLLALVLGGLQYYFNIVKLDPATYYMDTVPVNFDLGYILLLDMGVLLVSVAMLIVPTMLITRIKPIKAIRFE